MKATVKPKDASTVILLRKQSNQGETGFEVLMVLRHPDSSFVPDSYVFPGGGLQKGDCASEMEALCSGISQQQAYELLDGIPSPGKALGAWVAAIRETFEEVGILLAYREDGKLLEFRSADERNHFHRYRRLLIEDRIAFHDILKNEGLTLAADRLHYFSHWITPWFLPIRYDVRFFVAEAPSYQETLHDGVELTEHIWISPNELLDGAKSGRFDMVEPTMVTISEIAGFSTIREVISSTIGKKIVSRT